MANASEPETAIPPTELSGIIECSHDNALVECVDSVNALRKHPDYQDPSSQYKLAEYLKFQSGIHPPLLDIAYEILTQLLEEYPSSHQYSMARAYVKFYQNKLDGICEGRAVGAATLRDMLDSYLKHGHIQSDIKSLSMDAVQESIERNEPIHFTLTEIQTSLEKISRYGGDAEASASMSEIRNLIPWEEWNPNLWTSPSGTSELTLGNSRIFLATYCQAMMLKLDDGTFCEVAVSLIYQNADLEALAQDEELERLGSYIISNIDQLKPAKIGNSEKLLRKLFQFD